MAARVLDAPARRRHHVRRRPAVLRGNSAIPSGFDARLSEGRWAPGNRAKSCRRFLVIFADGRVDSVSKHHRSFLLASLLPAFLPVGVFAVVHAQQGRSASAAQTRWSDPATWPDRHVPRAGDKVTIPAGKEVVLDVSPPALGGLTIDGKLSFADNTDLELVTEWIVLHGELAIGSESSPHRRKATITLTNSVPDEEPIRRMGDRGIMI